MTVKSQFNLFQLMTTIEDQSARRQFLWHLLRQVTVLLVFGIILYAFQDVISNLIPGSVEPASVLGGTMILVALTFVGVPVLPAAIAGLSIFWLIQTHVMTHLS